MDMIIYKTTNLINGKYYIGKDKYNNPSYLGSGVVFQKALKKYGKSNFRKEILEECSSFDELNQKEIYWIKKLNATNKKIGYNVAIGGTGGYDKISQSIREHWKTRSRIVSQKTKRKLSRASRGKILKPLTKNQKVKILKLYQTIGPLLIEQKIGVSRYLVIKFLKKMKIYKKWQKGIGERAIKLFSIGRRGKNNPNWKAKNK